MGSAHIARVPFVVVQDKAAYPINVSMLGADRVMQHSYAFAHLVEQTLRARVG